jgi:hypothetical protein
LSEPGIARYVKSTRFARAVSNPPAPLLSAPSPCHPTSAPPLGRARDVSDKAVIHCKLGNFTVTVQRPGKVTSGLSTANLAIKASVAA